MKFTKLNNKYHKIRGNCRVIFWFLNWGKKENEEREVNGKNGDKCEEDRK
jgi:hypothetical protein